ncbi:dTMP kinase [Methanomicrobium sp. W14]|uniref:dTMP kinase n=1 Tax=Methanomicrobium sp. W14 TaxID=2817839 RepID=UPI001AE0FEFF|nr:dTMP kinase [Methanomicrobium sp. W14]MBP2134595.1 dTMP kinase [Methanomicrobium sp. W14]
MLVTVEGIDGSGKSTLLQGLAEKLKDLNPVFTREPGATWIGEQVRRGIKEKINPVAEALLFVADHAAHLDTVIRPALKEGRLVVSDRYTDSRYAYQSETLKGLVKDPKKWLEDIHNGWTISPDLTFLLMLPVEESLERINGKNIEKEHFECRAVLENVQANYLELAEKNPERFIVIDAKKDKKEILDFVSEIIRKKSKIARIN